MEPFEAGEKERESKRAKQGSKSTIFDPQKSDGSMKRSKNVSGNKQMQIDDVTKAQRKVLNSQQDVNDHKNNRGWGGYLYDGTTGANQDKFQTHEDNKKQLEQAKKDKALQQQQGQNSGAAAAR